MYRQVNSLEREWMEVEENHRARLRIQRESELIQFKKEEKKFSDALEWLRGSVRDRQMIFEHGQGLRKMVSDLVQQADLYDDISGYITLMNASTHIVMVSCTEIFGKGRSPSEKLTEDQIKKMEATRTRFAALADKVAAQLAPDWRDKLKGAVIAFVGVLIGLATAGFVVSVFETGYGLFTGSKAKAVDAFKRAVIDRQDEELRFRK